MSKLWEKYIQRLPKHFKIKLLNAILKITNNDLKNLDIKKLKGRETEYRCRIGKFRILFYKKEDFIQILGVDTRGDVY